MKCRHCQTELEKVFVDLGVQPPSNSYLTKEALELPEKKYPLRVLVCDKCFLVQTEDFADREEFFSNDYAYFSSQSKTFLAHAKAYVEMIVERLGLDSKSKVLEIASNDGYLLQYVREKGIASLGIEPTLSTAKVAIEKGLNVLTEFFGLKLSKKITEEIGTFDLVIGNNVLAHVPDINDFLKGVKTVLSKGGTATFEFPYLLNLIKYNQFDTIYHEHYSYFSVTALARIFDTNELVIYDIEDLETHGGSLRVYVQHKSTKVNTVKSIVSGYLAREELRGVKDLTFYESFQDKLEGIKFEFERFMYYCKVNKLKVIGYGAAAKANTFLNYMDATIEQIPFIVDTTPAKQGKFLPGSHIPVLSEEAFKDIEPDFVIIFPWNFKDEIRKRLREEKLVTNRCDLVTFIPEMDAVK